jgi:hypothetical protein
MKKYDFEGKGRHNTGSSANEVSTAFSKHKKLYYHKINIREK